MCLEEVKRTVLSLKDIDKQLKLLLKETTAASYLMSIPGVGPLSAAVFLGELGDPTHFHNARQIVKYAGYDPQESDFRLVQSCRLNLNISEIQQHLIVVLIDDYVEE
jgi:transposase